MNENKLEVIRMDNYLDMVRIEVLVEMVSEIRSYFMRYFRNHPDDKKNGSEVSKEYQKVLDISNSLIGPKWTNNELDDLTLKLNSMLSYAKRIGVNNYLKVG